jgi:hypothetical protein
MEGLAARRHAHLTSPCASSPNRSFLPSRHHNQDYTESFYTLMLPEEATGVEQQQQQGASCRSHAELLEEMVCQRLAQDFQLVETPGHRQDPARANAGLLKWVGWLPCRHGWMGGWMDGWIGGWMGGWMDGQINEIGREGSGRGLPCIVDLIDNVDLRFFLPPFPLPGCGAAGRARRGSAWRTRLAWATASTSSRTTSSRTRSVCLFVNHLVRGWVGR